MISWFNQLTIDRNISYLKSIIPMNTKNRFWIELLYHSFTSLPNTLSLTFPIATRINSWCKLIPDSIVYPIQFSRENKIQFQVLRLKIHLRSFSMGKHKVSFPSSTILSLSLLFSFCFMILLIHLVLHIVTDIVLKEWMN